jgi:hypothetical protein
VGWFGFGHKSYPNRGTKMYMRFGLVRMSFKKSSEANQIKPMRLGSVQTVHFITI